MYEPRIDVAVGPFAVQGRYGGDYDELVRLFEPELRRLVRAHQRNVEEHCSYFPACNFVDAVTRNHNARCLLAIEVEKGNRIAKYLMGSAFNAVALGRLGIIVCWNQTRLHDLLGLREYLCFLSSVQKNTFHPDNLLIVSCEQMDDFSRGTGLSIA
jgi:hypothetical protein